MRAMIFAAGLGTRLRPATNKNPKALVPLNGRPMLGHVIGKLKDSGFDEIVINVHHYAGQIKKYLKRNKYFGVDIIISDESNELLDTGGGLQKAAEWLDYDEPFLLHNVDIYSEIDLNDFYDTHCESGNLVSLAVRDRKSTNYLLFNEAQKMIGWESVKNKLQRMSRDEKVAYRYAFSGIHMISPEIFKYMNELPPFSIIGTYLNLAKEHPIGAYPHNEDHWIDLGKPEAIEKAEMWMNG